MSSIDENDDRHSSSSSSRSSRSDDKDRKRDRDEESSSSRKDRDRKKSSSSSSSSSRRESSSSKSSSSSSAKKSSSSSSSKRSDRDRNDKHRSSSSSSSSDRKRDRSDRDRDHHRSSRSSRDRSDRHRDKDGDIDMTKDGDEEEDKDGFKKPKNKVCIDCACVQSLFACDSCSKFSLRFQFVSACLCGKFLIMSCQVFPSLWRYKRNSVCNRVASTESYSAILVGHECMELQSVDREATNSSNVTRIPNFLVCCASCILHNYYFASYFFYFHSPTGNELLVLSGHSRKSWQEAPAVAISPMWRRRRRSSRSLCQWRLSPPKALFLSHNHVVFFFLSYRLFRLCFVRPPARKLARSARRSPHSSVATSPQWRRKRRSSRNSCRFGLAVDG